MHFHRDFERTVRGPPSVQWTLVRAAPGGGSARRIGVRSSAAGASRWARRSSCARRGWRSTDRAGLRLSKRRASEVAGAARVPSAARRRASRASHAATGTWCVSLGCAPFARRRSAPDRTDPPSSPAAGMARDGPPSRCLPILRRRWWSRFPVAAGGGPRAADRWRACVRGTFVGSADPGASPAWMRVRSTDRGPFVGSRSPRSVRRRALGPR